MPHEPAARAEGAACRVAAANIIRDVLEKRLALDTRLEGLAKEKLSGADKALARAIAVSAIRNLGSIRHILKQKLSAGMPAPSGALESLLTAGAAQILYLGIPDHAAVATAVEAARADRHARHFTGLANAVLRAVAREREALLAAADPLRINLAPWLRQRWIENYGEDAARKMAAAQAAEPPLDLTCLVDRAGFAEKLDALELPGGSFRLRGRTAVEELPGFASGAWIVQDAAAAIPARLMKFPPGARVLDMCAAPGGKTMQLIARGAAVTAVDRSAPRLKRLQANLNRLGFQAETHAADALSFQSEPFDAVLIDAPCSATGTIRRHPDVQWIKGAPDLAKLARLQAELLAHGAALVKPGGCLVYSTCSLEPEEGEARTAAFLAANLEFSRDPVGEQELPGLAEAVTQQGDVRTFPHFLPSPEPRLSGMDGFYAARLKRKR